MTEEPDICPLCRRERRIMDYHHWSYTQDIGVFFCRGCHDWVHQESRVRTQRQEAQRLRHEVKLQDAENIDWIDQAVSFLTVADLGFIDPAHAALSGHSTYIQFLKSRYNVPSYEYFPGWLLEDAIEGGQNIRKSANTPDSYTEPILNMYPD